MGIRPIKRCVTRVFQGRLVNKIRIQLENISRTRVEERSKRRNIVGVFPPPVRAMFLDQRKVILGLPRPSVGNPLEPGNGCDVGRGKPARRIHFTSDRFLGNPRKCPLNQSDSTEPFVLAQVKLPQLVTQGRPTSLVACVHASGYTRTTPASFPSSCSDRPVRLSPG